MSIFLNVIALMFYVVAIYLFLNVLYLLFFAIVGHRKLMPLVAKHDANILRMCVMLPAYRADDVILQTAPLAKKHLYKGEVDVYVIADGLQPATILALQNNQVGVIEVFFEKSTKGKPMVSALETLPQDMYDVAVILDVDNVMADGFLDHVNNAFSNGYRVVQGHRTAKNLDSPFAILDTCNEEINNHIFRQGHASIGLSAALIGSGMAFEYRYLKELLCNIGDTPGEDKEIDFRIVRNKIKIGYLPYAIVYDEKIPNSKAFTNQRTRWIAVQLEFLKKYIWEGPVQLMNGNFDFFDKVLQTLLVPRILLLGLLSVILVLSLSGVPLGPSSQFWVSLLIGTGLALLLSLPKRLYNRKVVGAIWHLPLALFAMVTALFQLKKAKDSFLPTPHSPTGVKLPQP